MDKKQLLKNYNKIASEYRFYTRKVWKPINNFLRNKKRILDLGCGECSLAKSYQKEFAGVDFSLEFLKKARCKYKICADIEHVPIKNNTFEAITSIAVLHHLNNKKSRLNFLKEIKRILKPKGEALLTSWLNVPEKKSKKIKNSDYLVPYGKYNRYYHIFTKKELENLLKQIKITYYISKTPKNIFIRLKNS